MTEGLQFLSMANLLMFASVAAIVASLNLWVLARYIGGESVRKKIKKIEQNPLALSIWLVGNGFSVFYLYASIFTRFTI